MKNKKQYLTRFGPVLLLSMLVVPLVALSNGRMARVVGHVSLGGADICEAMGEPTGCDANLSLSALVRADGSASGQWQDSSTGGRDGIHVAIDCVKVVDNLAIISGFITHGTVEGEDVTGIDAIIGVADNGTSANDQPDQVSISFFNTPFDCNSNFPPGFIQSILYDLHKGQVTIMGSFPD